MKSPREIFESFEATAASRNRPVCLEGEGPALCCVDLLVRIRRTGDRFKAAGVGPGDRIHLKGLSGLPLLEGLLEVWACDAVALPADATLASAEIERIREDFLPRFTLGPGSQGTLPLERTRESAGSDPLPPGTSVIKLTSGSTGRARGIAVGAAHLEADGWRIIRGMGIGPDDVNIAAIPLAHSYGLGNLVMPLVLQGSPLRFVDAGLAEPLRHALSMKERCVFPGVPALFEMLARDSGAAFTPRGLKLCLSAGAPLRRGTAAAFKWRYGLPVRALYGASECGGITFDASPEGNAAELEDGCVGTALPGVELRLEGEEERVAVRSAAVAHGYLQQAGSTGDGEFAQGWFRTGDTGRLDSGGRLTLAGRIGSLVNVAGRKVNPREVEQVLMTLPGVGDAVVVGMPDAARGEVLVACLVVRSEVTREGVMAHLRRDLAGYKLPKRILFLGEIPRNQRGKIDRGEILRIVESADRPDLSR